MAAERAPRSRRAPPPRAGGGARAKRGRLTIFFGAAPGVGKTYAMLGGRAAARRRGASTSSSGSSRRTAAPRRRRSSRASRCLPRRQRRVPRRRRSRSSTSTPRSRASPSALARRRARAHQRAGLAAPQALAGRRGAARRRHRRLHDAQRPAPREPQRRRRADHAACVVRETVPDSVLERADEIELVDLPPDELLERLREGKVYVPEQAERARRDTSSARATCIALRELALRTTAERVDARDARAGDASTASRRRGRPPERLLVCISPSPVSARLVRAARRMAAGLRAQLDGGDRRDARRPLRLSDDGPRARRGAPAARRAARRETGDARAGSAPSEAILRFARERNVTRIVVGKPTHPRWRDLVLGSLLDEVVRGAATSTSTSSPATRAERAPRAASAGGATRRSPPHYALERRVSCAPRRSLAFADVAAARARRRRDDLPPRHRARRDRFGRGPALVARRSERARASTSSSSRRTSRSPSPTAATSSPSP